MMLKNIILYILILFCKNNLKFFSYDFSMYLLCIIHIFLCMITKN